jgi:uncharacterized protein YndB with AHSA1/START domain
MSNWKEKWSSFDCQIDVKASIDEVYKAWTTEKGLNSWFLRTATAAGEDGIPRGIDAHYQSRDRFCWQWHGYDDEATENRKVVSANGKDTLSFRFSGDTLVTVRLSKFKDRTLVKLTQLEITFEEDPDKNLHVGCLQGWTFYLANLKSILEGGVDLRNKDMDIAGVCNA